MSLIPYQPPGSDRHSILHRNTPTVSDFALFVSIARVNLIVVLMKISSNSTTKNSSPSADQIVTERNEAEREAIRSRMKDTFKAAARLTIKNVVALLLVIGYSILGGFAYQTLEQPNERDTCFANQVVYQQMENATAKTLWTLSRTLDGADNQEELTAQFDAQASTFFSNVLAIGYDGTNCTALGTPGGPSYKWNFWASLLFAVTIITTVGRSSPERTVLQRLTWRVYAGTERRQDKL